MVSPAAHKKLPLVFRCPSEHPGQVIRLWSQRFPNVSERLIAWIQRESIPFRVCHCPDPALHAAVGDNKALGTDIRQ